MKTLTNNLIRKSLLVLSAVSALAATDAAQAASIKFEVRVPGYTGRGNGWVLVLPELRSQLGGRVQWDNSRGCYITDRVSRGEEIRTTINPSTGGEYCHNGAFAGIYAQNGVFSFRQVGLPYSLSNSVSRDPSFDNAYVWVVTTAGYFEKRVPIGSR